MTAPNGGRDRVSTKARLASELVVLGRVLTRAREARGMKQIELANALSVPASYLSKIENGSRRLDVIELLKIAAALGVDAAEIVRDLEAELREN